MFTLTTDLWIIPYTILRPSITISYGFVLSINSLNLINSFGVVFRKISLPISSSDNTDLISLLKLVFTTICDK